MSAICQSNPLKQFVAKSDQLRASGFGQVSRAVNGGAATARANTLEPQFGLAESQNLLMRVEAPDTMPLGGRAGASDTWVRQFSSMQLDDPLAFSNEYKNFYDSYERQQQQRPVETRMSTRELPRGMLERRNLVLPAMSLPPRNMDGYFDEEFDNVEKELQDEAARATSPLEPSEMDVDVSVTLDEEQQKFQQAASDIYSCLASRPSATTGFSSSNNFQMESKMQRSKFLGLMRSISDGVVTLKKNDGHDNAYNELYSPTTGEVVGNEYFHVQEGTQDRSGH